LSTLSPTPTAIPRDPGFTVDADPSGQRDGLRDLVAAIIHAAVKDLSPSHYRGWRQAQASAEEFFWGEDSNFTVLASYLDLDADMLRSRLLKKRRSTL
jgi:hypothetical protein